MSHRRIFLRQVAAALGAASVESLLPVDRALARTARFRSGTGGLDLRQIRGAYLLSPEITYFNHASIGTIPRIVHTAHKAYLDLCETNPWLYIWGGAWDDAREAVRAKAAAFVGARAGEIAITHNTTEGFNVLAQGLPLGPGDEVVFSSLNHPGASVCWEHQAATRGFGVRRFEFPIRRVPTLTEDDLLDIYDRQLTERTRVLVFPHVDNVVGLRHPMAKLTRLARERGVEFVAVDGAQTVGMLPVDVAAAGVDFFAASPHKWIQAPKGLGLLYARREVQPDLRAMWVTWGQERWADTVRIFEDYGTRNFPELMALGDALDFQQGIGWDVRTARLRELWDGFRDAMTRLSRVRWRSPTTWELGSSLFAIEVDGVGSPELFDRLYRRHGFVFRAFGDLNTARISPNLMTRDDDIARFSDAVRSLD